MDKDKEILDDQLDDDLFDLDLGDLSMDDNEGGKIEDEPDDDIIELIDLVEKGDEDIEEIAGETDTFSDAEEISNDLLTEMDEAEDDDLDLDFSSVNLDDDSDFPADDESEETAGTEEPNETDFDQLFKDSSDSDIGLSLDDSEEEEDLLQGLLSETDETDDLDAGDEIDDLELSDDIAEKDFEQLLGESDDLETESASDEFPETTEDSTEGFDDEPVDENILNSLRDLSVEEEAEKELESLLNEDTAYEDSEEIPMQDGIEEAGLAAASAETGHIMIRDEEPAEYVTTAHKDDTQEPVAISEEKIEEMLERVVERVLERTFEKVVAQTAREAMTEVAEKLITQAIDSLKKSLESSSD